jgi:hypothetical protein
MEANSLLHQAKVGVNSLQHYHQAPDFDDMSLFFWSVADNIRVYITSVHGPLEPGSSGSIVSDYGLDDRAIGVRSPAGAKDFSCSLCVQTGSGAHPASCTMGTGGPFPGIKRGRGVMLTTHPYLVPRAWMSRSYTSCPPKRLHGV